MKTKMPTILTEAVEGSKDLFITALDRFDEIGGVEFDTQLEALRYGQQIFVMTIVDVNIISELKKPVAQLAVKNR